MALRDINRVTICGKLDREPTLKTVETKSGSTQVCEFRLASYDRFKGKDGTEREIATYIGCVLWGDAGVDLMEAYAAAAGEPFAVLVEGKLSTRSYEKDGEKKYVTEVRVDSFVAVKGVEEPKPKPKPKPKPAAQPEPAADDDDSLPF